MKTTTFRVDNENGDTLADEFSTFGDAFDAAVSLWTQSNARPFGRGSIYVVDNAETSLLSVEVCGMGRVLVDRDGDEVSR
jgi:hypothetical protein